ncbi:MAG: ACP S-malonyltransferase [Endomicrobium sp.]|jgi:[acyl-carrier-protein] S-malonyltransferase|nr:ACP S-malonyltransferase [Endomicrobium sp.]
MSKIVLMFPGQGSQKVGMGKDFYNKYSLAKVIIDLLDSKVKEIMFDGPATMLRMTKYTQPSIFIVSLAILEVLKTYYNFTYDNVITMGHSLGEYSALCAAGFFDIQSGLNMVNTRAELLQQATITNPGTMVAIIGLNKTIVNNICYQVVSDGSYGICEAVNFNAPKQVVISGNINAVKEAVRRFNLNYNKVKTVYLNVEGAFHSSLMTVVATRMKLELNKYTFKMPYLNVYTNYDALLTTEPSLIKEKLKNQINNPVRWDDCVQNAISRGYNIFIEIGPGQVLSSLVKKIDIKKCTKVLHIEDLHTLELTLEALQK